MFHRVGSLLDGTGGSFGAASKRGADIPTGVCYIVSQSETDKQNGYNRFDPQVAQRHNRARRKIHSL